MHNIWLCLNPCCNVSSPDGKCICITRAGKRVFNPCCNGSSPDGTTTKPLKINNYGLNPCCNGSSPDGVYCKGNTQSKDCLNRLMEIKCHVTVLNDTSLNPCCNGSSPDGMTIPPRAPRSTVSILVVMDHRLMSS